MYDTWLGCNSSSCLFRHFGRDPKVELEQVQKDRQTDRHRHRQIEIRGGSRICEGGVAGVEYGRAPKGPVAERRRRELLGGSGGMPPWEILKSQVSEMIFPAF